MNLESLKIGQNLLCRFTVGNAGLICRELPGPGLDSAGLTGLTRGWPGPALSALGPCGGIALPCCTGLGFTLSTLALLGGTFGLSVLGSLDGRFGAGVLGLWI